jgi:putative transposase
MSSFRPRERKILRLKGYDYAQPGAYFVTVCTQHRDCLFGEVAGGEMRLNLHGQTVAECWKAIPEHFGHVQTDEFVVMPNHVHGILVITPVGATHASPLRGANWTGARSGPRPGSLSAIAGSFKTAASKQINRMLGNAGESVWQRNYYEHVIRDEAELNRVREYIASNPANWNLDVDNPQAGQTP